MLATSSPPVDQSSTAAQRRYAPGYPLSNSISSRSGTYLLIEDCVVPQTTGARQQSFAGKVRPGRKLQFPILQCRLSHAIDELSGDLLRNGVPFSYVPDGSHTPVSSLGVTQAPYLGTIQRTLREHAIDRQAVGLPEEHSFLLALRHRTLSTVCYPPDRQQHGENNQKGQSRIRHRGSFRER